MGWDAVWGVGAVIMEDIQAGTHWGGSQGGLALPPEMRAPDTGLGGAAAMAARWPKIGQAAERKASRI